MTVSSLIEKLSELPGDRPVCDKHEIPQVLGELEAGDDEACNEYYCPRCRDEAASNFEISSLTEKLKHAEERCPIIRVDGGNVNLACEKVYAINVIGGTVTMTNPPTIRGCGLTRSFV